MSKVVTTHDSAVQKLIAEIKQTFGLPDHILHFSIHFKEDAMVVVDASYLLSKKEDKDE